mgnify:CR=1 FL=1
MEITIIHGQEHMGSTYHITNMVIKQLVDDNTKVNEYFMPKDTPAFCSGCFNCIQKGEYYCPEADRVQRIVQSMLHSQIIVIDSPTYCFEISGQLKTLFDHLGYMWLSHRPRKEMFTKIGVAISTAAGAGARRVTKSIVKQMFWWGMPKTYQIHFIVNAACWEDVSKKTKDKIIIKSKRISRKVKRQIGKAKPNIISILIFNIMRKMQQSNTWNMVDRNYWQRNNWLKKERS